MITWKPRAVGDIFVGTLDEPVIATYFGGDSDSMDNGETASGLFTKHNPDILGCSLPMPLTRSTFGSPLPVMPYIKTLVEVSTRDYNIPDPATGFNYITKSITLPLIDLGPALWTNHAIDLTIAAFQKLNGDLKAGTMKVMFRIIGGAQYLLPN